MRCFALVAAPKPCEGGGLIELTSEEVSGGLTDVEVLIVRIAARCEA